MTERKNRKYRILISGGYGNGNAGDEALIITMLEHLRNEFNGYCEIKIFSDNVDYSRQRYTEDFIYSGGRGICEEGKKGIGRITWFFHNVKAITWCDLFITGGGTILQDSTNFIFVPFWIAKIILALFFRKKTMMYGIGVGPMRTKFARFLSKLIVNRMDLITLRGSSSYEELKGMGINSPPIYTLTDPAFTLKPISPERGIEILKLEGVDIEHSFVAFAVRQWYITHRKSLHGQPVWETENRLKYEAMTEAFAAVADHLLMKYKKQVVFIPMSIVGTKDDRQAARDIVAQIKHAQKGVHIIQGDYTPQEIKALIGQSCLLIAMRLHSAIFAVPLQVPIIPVAYGKKMKDFLGEFGLGDLVIPLEDINNNRVLALVDEVFTNPKKFVVPKTMIEQIQQKAVHNSILAYQLLSDRLRIEQV